MPHTVLLYFCFQWAAREYVDPCMPPLFLLTVRWRSHLNPWQPSSVIVGTPISISILRVPCFWCVEVIVFKETALFYFVGN